MPTFSIGPLALPALHAVLLLSLFSAMGIGWFLSRTAPFSLASLLFNLFLLGIGTARLGFVLTYWTEYSADLWRIVDIRDGGFLAWPGLVASTVAAIFWAARHRQARRALCISATCGLALWTVGHYALATEPQPLTLPNTPLFTADGQRVTLADYTGKPLIINLWASWCPPCRREMPALQAAQERYNSATFLFVNLGESHDTVTAFLHKQNLVLDNLLFDTSSTVAHGLGATALPTTLFIDKSGVLVDTHVGELSRGTLAHYLRNIAASKNASPAPNSESDTNVPNPPPSSPARRNSLLP